MYRTSLALLILSLFVMIAGCGYNPEDPAYDTSTNPDGFPPKALALLDDIEDGELSTYEAITSRFADLYTENSELLDNQEWKSVIDRVGYKFRYRADQAVASGVAGYTEAAGMYMLASFAHPGDSRLAEKSHIFSAWTDEVRSEDVNGLTAVQGSLTDQLEFLRRFELSDSLHREFSRQYLRRQLFASKMSGQSLNEASLSSLDSVDRAFVAYLGLADVELKARQASFEEEGIDFVTSRVTPQGEGWYLVEMYFHPNRKVQNDYTIAVRLFPDDSGQARSSGSKPAYLPFDFEPHQPTSAWQPGKLFVAAKRIYYDGTPRQVKIGLYDRAVGTSAFLSVAGSEDTLISLPLMDNSPE